MFEELLLTKFRRNFTTPKDECWTWIGRYNRFKQPLMRHKEQNYMAIDLAWQLTYGHIAPNHVIEQQCKHNTCVNPEHLVMRKLDDCEELGITTEEFLGSIAHLQEEMQQEIIRKKVNSKRTRALLVQTESRTIPFTEAVKEIKKLKSKNQPINTYKPERKTNGTS